MTIGKKKNPDSALKVPGKNIHCHLATHHPFGSEPIRYYNIHSKIETLGEKENYDGDNCFFQVI